MVRTTDVSSELVEQSRVNRAAEPSLAKAARQRRAKRADGDVHGVDRAVRTSRVQDAADAREADRPESMRWVRASALPAVKPPPGLAVKWVRCDNRHRGDRANLTRMLAEGWAYARKSQFPNAVLPTQRFADQGEVIGNDSTVLMVIPRTVLAQRDAYWKNRRNKATAAIDNPKGDGLPAEVRHKAMPIVENKSENESMLERTRTKRRVGGGSIEVAED